MERRPTPIQPAGQCLEVGRRWGRRTRRPRGAGGWRRAGRREPAARERRGSWAAGPRAARGRARRAAGRAEADTGRGDPQRGLVGEDPWVASPCSSSDSPWSAVSTTERPPGLPRRQDRLEEGAECGIGRGHLAVVGVAAEARGGRLGRLVGIMRLEDVHPAEDGPSGRGPRAIGARGPPCRGPAAPRAGRPAGRGVRPDEGVVVDLEPAAQPEPRREREGADEGPGPVAAGGEEGRERLHPRREAEAGVVAHAVVEGIAARRGCWRARAASSRCARGPRRSAPEAARRSVHGVSASRFP